MYDESKSISIKNCLLFDVLKFNLSCARIVLDLHKILLMIFTANFIKTIIFCFIFYAIGCNALMEEKNDVNVNESKSSANTFSGKVMLSKDHGETWINASSGLADNLNIIAAACFDGKMMIGGHKSDLFIFQDSAWIKNDLRTMQMQPLTKHDNYFVSHVSSLKYAAYADIMYDALYRKVHGKKHWQPIVLPENIYFINDVAEISDQEFLISAPEGLYHTIDNGQSWTKIYKLGTVLNVEYLNNSILISTYDGLKYSDNFGAEWTSILIPEMPSLMMENKPEYAISRPDGKLIITRTNGKGYANVSGKILESIDGGKTWKNHPADNYIKQLDQVTSFLMDGNNWYCSYAKGVVKSTDQGKTWTTILSQDYSKVALMIYVSEGVLYCVERSFGC